MAWALVFAIRNGAGIRWIPSTLAIICLLAAFGPWSAGAISRRSQFVRLTRLLEADGLMAGGKIRAPGEEKALPSKEYEDLRSTIDYLARYHGVEAIRGLFGGLFKKMEAHISAYDILTKWNIQSGVVSHYFNYYNIHLEFRNVSSVEGFKRISVFNHLFRTPDAATKNDGALYIVLKDGMLEAADSAEAPLEPLPLEAFFDASPDRGQTASPIEEMTADFQRHGHDYRIIFTEIECARNKGEHTRVRDCSFLLLEK